MAVDEAIAEAVRAGIEPPTLRLYTWDRPAVSIGCFQASRAVNLSHCEQDGIPLVRRITGGRAILHGREITYSFSAPLSDSVFSKGLLDSYRRISNAFGLAFKKIGLEPETKAGRDRSSRTSRNPLCFHAVSFAEVSLQGRKVIGSAQKRWRDGLLQQGSIPLELDLEMMRQVFFLDPSYDPSFEMTGLSEVLPGLDGLMFMEILRQSFEEIFSVALVQVHLSREELRRAEDLEMLRYRSPEWNLQR